MLELFFQHWPLILLAVLAITVLGIAAVLLKYIRLMLNIIRDSPPPLLMGPIDFQHLNGSPIMFRAFDGTLLRGMFLSKAHLTAATNSLASDNDTAADCLTSTTRGVIIFCHEYGSDMHSCNRYCHGLLAAGYVVFTFDFRSHGSSAHLPGYQARLWCTDKEVADVLGAIALVRDELQEAEFDLPIALFGISRGAGAAILAAHQIRQTKAVSAIIADSAFSTDTVLEYSMKKWAHVFARVRIIYENHHPAFYRFLRWTLLKLARVRFHCRFPLVRKALPHLRDEPIFFIHGHKDPYIRPEQTQKLFQITRPPRHLWIVPNAKHNQSAIVEPDRYTARTIGFLEKYMPTAVPLRSAVADNYQHDVAEFFARNDTASWPTPTPSENEHANKNHRTHSRNHRRPSAQAVQSETTTLPRRAEQTAAEDSPS